MTPISKKDRDAIIKADRKKNGKKGGRSTLKKRGKKYFKDMIERRWKNERLLKESAN